MLTDAELNTLRLDMRALMPDTCVIRRAAETTGTAGFTTKIYSAVGTAVCRIDPLGNHSDQRPVAAQDTLTHTRQLTVPHDTDLRADDRVDVGGRNYEVRQLHDDHSQRAARRAILVEMEV